MKKLILLLSTCIVVCSTKAQTVHYFNKTVEQKETADSAAWAITQPAKGKILIDRGVIVISPVGNSLKIMAIVHRGKWEAYDEGYQLQELIVAELTGVKTISVYSVLVLRDERKRITDITLKYSGKQISYQIRHYRPGQYGYKLEHGLKTD